MLTFSSLRAFYHGAYTLRMDGVDCILPEVFNASFVLFSVTDKYAVTIVFYKDTRVLPCFSLLWYHLI